MREVAALAGVSVQTVSNVVNGRTHLMSERTRERVSEALERLGYWPNAAARSLRARRNTTLGFLVLDDNRPGAAALVEHLAAGGRRRIAFLSTRTPWPMVEERIVGYREGLGRAGIAADPALELAKGVWDAAVGARMATALLRTPRFLAARMAPSASRSLPHRLQRLRVRRVRRSAAHDRPRPGVRPRARRGAVAARRARRRGRRRRGDAAGSS